MITNTHIDNTKFTFPHASEATQKADKAKHFANKYKSSGTHSLKSAWFHGGAHCYLAAYSALSPIVEELVITSAVAVVEHIIHVADELDKMDLIDMPDRRKRKEQNKYLRKALEAYLPTFYQTPVEKALYYTTPDAGYHDATQIFHNVIKNLPNDISPQTIYENKQPILTLMMEHVSEKVDQADVIKFVTTYDPFTPRHHALGKRQKERLTRRANERFQRLDPSRTAYDVAMATHYQDMVA
ncbi:hypothetical protein SYK_32170 [Pseudodesulfovibrio nedwellii]|uniref:Uncharacterized protein n=1 Tax=Pseudodesulfovibrio nedwellii TaxID=2973072 RepID=A0ABN6S962_9BACT|nr:hypothetical protein [Pseudodesulfovibrio nedwellii]BDQ38857.1 hypothetical protein SYK_32170 [Pseudodesulfovibrio nedwellii]